MTIFSLHVMQSCTLIICQIIIQDSRQQKLLLCNVAKLREIYRNYCQPLLLCNKLLKSKQFSYLYEGPGGLMSQVVGLPSNSYKPITNTRGYAPGFVNCKKGCTRLAAASDKVYQLLSHGRWSSPGTPVSSTTKTGRHDIAEISLKMA